MPLPLTRHAISPLLAIRILSNVCVGRSSQANRLCVLESWSLPVESPIVLQARHLREGKEYLATTDRFLWYGGIYNPNVMKKERNYHDCTGAKT